MLGLMSSRLSEIPATGSALTSSVQIDMESHVSLYVELGVPTLSPFKQLHRVGTPDSTAQRRPRPLQRPRGEMK